MWGISKKIIQTISSFPKKHWFWYTLIMAFPTVWFSIIIPFWGVILGLQDDSGVTLLGIILSLVLSLPVAAWMILNNWYSSKFEKERVERLESEISYLGTITESVDKICDEKYDRLRRIIEKVKTGDIDPPQIVTRPNNQLKRIISGITSCLVEFLKTSEQNFQFKDFLVSIAYCFPVDDGKWKWADGMEERDFTLDDLLAKECKSTFRYLMESGKPYYFNNKKENAKSVDRYCYNKQDELNSESGEPVGSIFCHNFKIKRGSTVYVDAYLSISTTKKRFSVDDNEICNNTKNNMVSLVKDSFGRRIGIELCLLYLEFLSKNKT